eukprot:Nitzschia sp. Nitz4//scaffold282_size24342//23663//24640//NITZ4_008357-RA/size24342-processed-gene-0.29-mRNA-1//1//CDS//3329545635//3525//frame0
MPASLKRAATGLAVINLKNEEPVRDSAHFYSTFAAGAGSGIFSGIICAPLDLMRTRLQALGGIRGTPTHPGVAFQEILQNEGWPGLFRGLGATLLTVPLFWGVYFPLYDETKYQVSKRFPDVHPSLVHGGSAVFTGAVADVICNPLFVIRTRLQTQALHQLAGEDKMIQKGMWSTAKGLYEAHGLLAFWRGMAANLMGLSHVAVQFPAYEFLKKKARERHVDDEPETALELLAASAMAKMCASVLTYPHEVIRSRMMDSRASVSPTLLGTTLNIIRNEGYIGLYTGLHVSLVRVIPNTCITFLSYEFLARWAKEKYTEWKAREQV